MKHIAKWDMVVVGCALAAIALLTGAVLAYAHGNLSGLRSTFVGAVAAGEWWSRSPG